MVKNLIQLDYVKHCKKMSIKFITDEQVDRFIKKNGITDYDRKQVAYK